MDTERPRHLMYCLSLLHLSPSAVGARLTRCSIFFTAAAFTTAEYTDSVTAPLTAAFALANAVACE